jgi:hypothetical protein
LIIWLFIQIYYITSYYFNMFNKCKFFDSSLWK